MCDFEKSVQWKRKPIKTSIHASKFRGVTWYDKGKSWRSRIGFKGKKKILGYFKNEIEAAIAYNKAAIEYHGTNAILNEVKPMTDNRKDEMQ